MHAIDQIFKLLAENRGWHTIDEITEKIQIPKTEAADIINFLAAHKFIQLDRERKRAKIGERTNRFLTEIKKEEEQEINELNALH